MVAQLLLLAVAPLVAMMLLNSGWAKVREPLRSMQSIAGYGLVPDVMVPFLSRALPLSEIAVAVALFVAPADAVARVGGAALLGLFSMVVLFALVSGKRDIDCGCGGEPQPISLGLAIRNGLMATLLLLPTSGSGMLHWLLATASGIALFLLMIAWNSLHAQQRRYGN